MRKFEERVISMKKSSAEHWGPAHGFASSFPFTEIQARGWAEQAVKKHKWAPNPSTKVNPCTGHIQDNHQYQHYNQQSTTTPSSTSTSPSQIQPFTFYNFALSNWHYSSIVHWEKWTSPTPSSRWGRGVSAVLRSATQQAADVSRLACTFQIQDLRCATQWPRSCEQLRQAPWHAFRVPAVAHRCFCEVFSQALWNC